VFCYIKIQILIMEVALATTPTVILLLVPSRGQLCLILLIVM